MGLINFFCLLRSFLKIYGICEKPITINKDEIKEILKAAEENKMFFMEAMKTRFLPVNQKVKQLITEGIIGDVRLLQADFGFEATFDPFNRFYNKNLGGGALLDVGIYTVSYSCFIFGNNPLRIKSDLYFGNTGVDESASVSLSYENGKQAQLYGAINLQTRREANIIGTKGRSGNVVCFGRSFLLVVKFGSSLSYERCLFCMVVLLAKSLPRHWGCLSI